MITPISPKIDFVFHKLFGSEQNKDLLISLINSVVAPTPYVVEVTLKSPFNLADYRDAKVSILDIKAVDQAGVVYDIEMQVQRHILYGKRAIYYLAKTYADQIDTGDDYSKLNTTIGIHFLDFEYFADPRVLRQFVLKDTETNDAPAALSDVRLYFVEMPKLDKDWPQIRTALDRWVAFMNKAEQLSSNALPDELAAEPTVTKAVAELERIGQNPEEREIYEAEVKARMVDQIQLKTAEREGEQRGILLGRQEGITVGRQEGAQSLLMQMLRGRLGELPANIEATVRGLSAERINDLALRWPDFNTVDDVKRWLQGN